MKAALLKILAAVAACVWLTAPLAARAQDTGASVIKVDLARLGQSQSLALPAGRSAVVDLPVDARDVLVTNPAVAQAVLRTPRRIFVLGLKSGVTDAMFFDAAGRRILALNIRVDQNTSALAETINRILPGAQVHVEAINNSIILSGVGDERRRRRQGGADRPRDGRQARDGAQHAQHRRPGPGDAEGADRRGRPPGHQAARLQLERRDRPGRHPRSSCSAARHLRHQRRAAGRPQRRPRSTPRRSRRCRPTTRYQAARPADRLQHLHQRRPKTIATIQTTAGSTASTRRGDIQAFEQVGLVRTLAEPNLTAVSGEAAKFLVGGEFPVPVGRIDHRPGLDRIQALRRRPRLHAGGAVGRAHLAEAVDRGLRAQQPGRVQRSSGTGGAGRWWCRR